MRKLIRFRPLNPPKPRRINRAFNAFIQPKSSDIEHVERDRRKMRNERWISKGSPV